MDLSEKIWEKFAQNYITECVKLNERGRDICECLLICKGILSKEDKYAFNNEEECIVTIELDELTECKIERIWVDRNTNKIMASLKPINISEANYIEEFDTCLDDEEYIDWSYIISFIIDNDSNE